MSFATDEWFDQMEEHPQLALRALGALAVERERIQRELSARTGEIVLR